MTTGIVAILRGLTPDAADAVGDALYDAGIRALEVPLNSPDPCASIAALRAGLPQDCVVGAGTVLTVGDVHDVHRAGAELVVSPNTSPKVIEEAVRLGMVCFPGAATPSEALTGLTAGATGLKVFPAQQVGPHGLKAWVSVLPQGIELLAVGGVEPRDFATWAQAGATGCGLGSWLYTPQIALADLRRRAQEAVETWSAIREGLTPRGA